jgi:hypothetical protein
MYNHEPIKELMLFRNDLNEELLKIKKDEVYKKLNSIFKNELEKNIKIEKNIIYLFL